jgi:hypothetical protein
MSNKERFFPMSLSQQEIIDYASPYVDSGEAVDFPFNGDLFCLIGRDLPEGKILAEEEGWSFQGYGVCLGYTLDQEAKPTGAWLWMHYASLAVFPPAQQVFKLQPPHVVKGRFQNPGRTNEFKIIKINLHKSSDSAQSPSRSPAGFLFGKTQAAPPKAPPNTRGKIVQFRLKKKFEGGNNGPEPA